LPASFGLFARLVGNRDPAAAAIIFEIESEAIGYGLNWFDSRAHPEFSTTLGGRCDRVQRVGELRGKPVIARL
jgi:hypothetical protein